jgi:hypothetical protein
MSLPLDEPQALAAPEAGSSVDAGAGSVVAVAIAWLAEAMAEDAPAAAAGLADPPMVKSTHDSYV